MQTVHQKEIVKRYRLINKGGIDERTFATQIKLSILRKRSDYVLTTAQRFSSSFGNDKIKEKRQQEWESAT
jgi:hypothetical protein